MSLYLMLKWLHALSSVVLVGTGMEYHFTSRLILKQDTSPQEKSA